MPTARSAGENVTVASYSPRKGDYLQKADTSPEGEVA